MSDEATKSMNEFNKLVAEHFPQLIRRQAQWKYYADKKGNRYFYTVKKISCGCKRNPKDGHYVAGVYRFVKSKKQYKLARKVCFAKKCLAIAWAQKECDKNIRAQMER
jgi:hypothetical protein